MATSNEVSIRLAVKDAQVVTAALDSVGQKIDDLKAPAQRASAELEKVGMSARQTAAAMRSVPAQFTDIVTSLQGGQSPMTVLLQQGGQLKDMFGGVGNAAKAMGSYVVGLVNPINVAVAAAGTLGYAYYSAGKELDEYNKALILNGNAVGMTSGQLQGMAKDMAAVGGTQGKAAEALSAFAAAGDVGSDSLQRFAQSAINLEKTTGIAIDETVQQFSKLGEKPLEASIKLNESTNFLTMSVYQQIKALEEQGKHTEAAQVAQDAYADTINQRAGQITANLGTIERAWNAVASAGKGAWDSIKNIGRADTPEQKLAKLSADIVQAENNYKYAVASSFGGEKSPAALSYKRELDLLRDKNAELSKTVALSQIRAVDRGIEVQQLNDQIAFDKAHEKHMTNAVKLQQELAKAAEMYSRVTHDGELGEQNRKAYEDTVAKLKDQYKEKEEKTAAPQKEHLTEQQRALESYVNSLQKQIYKEEELTEAQKARNFLNSLGVTGQIENVRKLVLGMAEQVDASRALTQAEKEHQAALDGVEKAGNAAVATLEKQIAAQDLHNASIGQTKEQIELEKMAQLDAGTAELQLQADAYQMALDKGLVDKKNLDIYQRQLGFLKDELVLRGRLSQKLDEGAQKEAAYQQVRLAQEEWRRGWEETDRLGRDVFTTWGMDGANMAQKIGDTLRRALLSAVYEATIKPVVFQLYTSVMGNAPLGEIGRAGNMISGVSGSGTLASFLGIGSGISSGLGSISAGLQAGWSGTSIAQAMQAYQAAGMGGIAMGMQAGQLLAQATPYVAAIAAAANVLERTTGSVAAAGTFAYGHNSGSGFQVGGRQDYIQDGGLFGGGTTKNSSWFDPGEATSQYMAAAGNAVTDSVKGWATTIGLSATAVDGYSKQIEASIGGLDAVGIKSSIDKAMVGYSEGLTQATYGLSTETLKSLATNLSGVNAIFEAVGVSALDASMGSATLASNIADAAGGLDKLSSLTGALYDAVTTPAQKAADSAAKLDKAFAALGVSTPKTANDLEKLVRAQDLTSEAGRKAAVGILALLPALDQVQASVKSVREAMLKDAGVDQGSLSSVIKKGLMEGNVQGIGGAVSDTLIQGVQDALYGKMADRIAGAFTDNMIAPVLEAMGKGATLSEALAGLSMDDIKTKYQRTVDDISSIFDNAQITSGMGSLKGAIQDLFNTASYSIPKAVATSAGTQVQGSFAVGTPYVPNDMIAEIHQGEAIIPAQFNPFNPSAQASTVPIVVNMPAITVEQVRQDLPGMAAWSDSEVASWMATSGYGAVNNTAPSGYYENGFIADSRAASTAKDLESAYKSLSEDYAQTYIDALRAMGDVYMADTLALDKATEGFDDLHKAMYLEVQAGKQLIDMRANLAQITKEYANSEVEFLKARGNTRGAAVLQRTQDLQEVTTQKTAAQKRLKESGLSDMEKLAQEKIVETADLFIGQYDAKAKRQAEIDILAAQEAAQKNYLDATERVTAAQKTYAGALNTSIKSLKDFLTSLDAKSVTGNDLQASRTNFAALSAQAASGDTSAYDKLAPAGRAMLDLSEKYSRTLQDYRRDEATVRASITKVIGKAEAQLATLPAEVARAADPIKDAWDALQKATNEQTNARTLLTAMGVKDAEIQTRRTTAEEELAAQYEKAIALSPDYEALKNAFDTAEKYLSYVGETKTDIALTISDRINAAIPENLVGDSVDLTKMLSDKIDTVFPQYLVSPETDIALMFSDRIDTAIPESMAGAPFDLAQMLSDQVTTVVLPQEFAGETSNLATMLSDQVSKVVLPEEFAGKPSNLAAMLSGQINAVLPGGFAGAAFDAGVMMQTAIDKAIASSAAAITNTISATVTQPTASTAPYATTNQAPASSSSGAYTTLAEKFSAASFATRIDVANALGLSEFRGPADIEKAFSSASLYARRSVAVTLGLPYPSYDVGTNFVPRDTIAQIHQGEQITPRPYVDAQRRERDQTNALLAQLLRSNEELRAELAQLRTLSASSADSAKRTASVLTRVTRDGNALLTTAA